MKSLLSTWGAPLVPPELPSLPLRCGAAAALLPSSSPFALTPPFTPQDDRPLDAKKDLSARAPPEILVSRNLRVWRYRDLLHARSRQDDLIVSRAKPWFTSRPSPPGTISKCTQVIAPRVFRRSTVQMRKRKRGGCRRLLSRNGAAAGRMNLKGNTGFLTISAPTRQPRPPEARLRTLVSAVRHGKGGRRHYHSRDLESSGRRARRDRGSA